MSRENVEVVRRGYEALNAGNLEEVFALFDPEVEVEPGLDPDGTGGLDFRGTYRGVEGFLQFLAEIAEAWEDPRWVAEGFEDAGEDVVVFIRFIGKGKGSGVEINQPIAHVCTVRDGKLIKAVAFWDRGAALEAVGLRE
jgi:uncharacterized protein